MELWTTRYDSINKLSSTVRFGTGIQGARCIQNTLNIAQINILYAHRESRTRVATVSRIVSTRRLYCGNQKTDEFTSRNSEKAIA